MVMSPPVSTMASMLDSVVPPSVIASVPLRIKVSLPDPPAIESPAAMSSSFWMVSSPSEPITFST